MKSLPPTRSRVALHRRANQALPPSPWEQQSRHLLQLWQQRLRDPQTANTAEAA